MGVLTIGIVNSSGGKIFTRYVTSPPTRDQHWETYASMLSTYCFGFSKQISPVPADPLDSSPLRLIEGKEHDLHIFWTPTKIGFFALTTSGHPIRREFFQELYVAYVDLVLKHPAYAVDAHGAGQPIPSEVFDAFTAAVDSIAAKAQKI